MGSVPARGSFARVGWCGVGWGLGKCDEAMAARSQRPARPTRCSLPALDPARPLQFFGTWCSSCKALLPHLIKLAEGDDDTHWLLVDYGQFRACLGRTCWARCALSHP